MCKDTVQKRPTRSFLDRDNEEISRELGSTGLPTELESLRKTLKRFALLYRE